jgi:hypothetical protein
MDESSWCITHCRRGNFDDFVKLKIPQLEVANRDFKLSVPKDISREIPNQPTQLVLVSKQECLLYIM